MNYWCFVFVFVLLVCLRFGEGRENKQWWRNKEQCPVARDSHNELKIMTGLCHSDKNVCVVYLLLEK